jgi:tetratricopeptide (TPR) repeat protein
MLERLDRPAEALGFHEEALSLAAEHGLASTQARALHYLGRGLDRLGQRQAALRHHCRALRIYRRLQDPRSQADALCDIGSVLAHLGRVTQAIRAQRKALDLAVEAQAPGVQAKILNELGDAFAALDDETGAGAGAGVDTGTGSAAIDAYLRARALAQRVGDTAQKTRADAALRAHGYMDTETDADSDGGAASNEAVSAERS